MDLFLFRHAAAVRLTDPETESDAARALTPRGRRRFRRVVRALEKRRLRVHHLLHSPMLRAVQTADLLLPILRGETEVCAELGASPTPALLDRLVGERVGLVGHNPWLGELVGLLVGGPSNLVEWRKGGLVWLSGDPAPGQMCVRAVVPRGVLG